jgi:hypothetical protein
LVADLAEPVDEGVDEPNGIVGANVVVHRLRQQQDLRTFESWPILSRQARQRNPLSQTFRTVCKIYAQTGNAPL